MMTPFFSSPVKTALRAAAILLLLLPPVWMLLGALHPPGQPLSAARLLPASISAGQFGRLTQLLPLARLTLNSLAVTAVAVPAALLISSWAGFAIARLPRPRQRVWLLLTLAALITPTVALWPTRFLVFRALGWLDSWAALIAPALLGGTPFYVLMFYRAFRRLPRELFDAARCDGATPFQVWRLVAMPQAQATAVAVALLAFLFFWSDFLSPLLYLSDPRRHTLPVGLQLLQQLGRSDWPLMLAGAVWATAVPVALFLLAQPILNRKQ